MQGDVHWRVGGGDVQVRSCDLQAKMTLRSDGFFGSICNCIHCFQWESHTVNALANRSSCVFVRGNNESRLPFHTLLTYKQYSSYVPQVRKMLISIWKRLKSLSQSSA